MMMPPPVPELDAARWSAIDDKVLSAVAAEMARPSLWRTLRSWWETPVLKPALAFAAMAAVALVVVLAPRSSTVTVPEPLPPEPIAALPGELVNEAAVVSAVESSSDAVELKAAKKVAKGARVATRAQGEACCGSPTAASWACSPPPSRGSTTWPRSRCGSRSTGRARRGGGARARPAPRGQRRPAVGARGQHALHGHARRAEQRRGRRGGHGRGQRRTAG
jgi:hypothetical protein